MTKPRFLVVGNPIEHSRSPEIHTHFAAQFGIDMSYERALVPVDAFRDFVTRFAQTGGRGLNVTLPFKFDAHDFVTELDPLAASAQAVNTIALDSSSNSRGFNTDGGGLLRDLKDRHGQQVEGATVVMLGAGGAAQGVMGALLAERPALLLVANRTLGRAQDLVRAVQKRDQGQQLEVGETTVVKACALQALSGDPAELGLTDTLRPDLIINATSFGHVAQAKDEGLLISRVLGLSADWVGDAFCYDMTYGQGAVFHRWAEQLKQGAGADGLGMLVEQAALSFNIWHGVMPQTNELLVQMRNG